jgi:hypothetical protein
MRAGLLGEEVVHGQLTYPVPVLGLAITTFVVPVRGILPRDDH